jgi:hypothetical protein
MNSALFEILGRFFVNSFDIICKHENMEITTLYFMYLVYQ